MQSCPKKRQQYHVHPLSHPAHPIPCTYALYPYFTFYSPTSIIQQMILIWIITVVVAHHKSRGPSLGKMRSPKKDDPGHERPSLPVARIRHDMILLVYRKTELLKSVTRRGVHSEEKRVYAGESQRNTTCRCQSSSTGASLQMRRDSDS